MFVHIAGAVKRGPGISLAYSSSSFWRPIKFSSNAGLLEQMAREFYEPIIPIGVELHVNGLS